MEHISKNVKGGEDMYYGEVLKLCGFEDAEIERERPRIERAVTVLPQPDSPTKPRISLRAM